MNNIWSVKKLYTFKNAYCCPFDSYTSYTICYLSKSSNLLLIRETISRCSNPFLVYRMGTLCNLSFYICQNVHRKRVFLVLGLFICLRWICCVPVWPMYSSPQLLQVIQYRRLLDLQVIFCSHKKFCHIYKGLKFLSLDWDTCNTSNLHILKQHTFPMLKKIWIWLIFCFQILWLSLAI